MKNLLNKIVPVLTLITIIACSKEGPQGPAGTNGTNGNANIMYSEWVTYNPQAGSSANKKMYLYNTQINNNFIDSGGIVLGFVRLFGNEIYQAPFMRRYNTTSSPLIEINAHAYTSPPKQNVTFECFRADGADLNTDFTNLINTSNFQVRYFLIKGNIPLRLRNGISIKDYYKSKSYEEICTLAGAKP